MEENKPKVTVLSVESSQAVQADALVESGLELAQMGIAQMCTGIKMMHDGKLYKCFGFKNFEEYCKSKGFTRRHGERLIKIAEMLESENATTLSHFEKIGASKLFQLAMLEPEQREEVIQKVDVESVTVKELKAEISTLKQNNQKLKDKQKQAESRISELEIVNEELEEERTEYESRIITLEREKEELENRPVEVAVQEVPAQSHEQENLIHAMHVHDREWREKYDELQEKKISDEREMMQKHQKEIDSIDTAHQSEIQSINAEHQAEVNDLKGQLAEKEKQLAEKSDVLETPEMKKFRIRIATVCDSIEQLMNFLCENPDFTFLDKSENIIRSAETSLTEIRRQVQA